MLCCAVLWCAVARRGVWCGAVSCGVAMCCEEKSDAAGLAEIAALAADHPHNLLLGKGRAAGAPFGGDDAELPVVVRFQLDSDMDRFRHAGMIAEYSQPSNEIAKLFRFFAFPDFAD